MTTSINTNISAYFAQNSLKSASMGSSSSISRLSSGDRIVRAADDVAGLSVGTVLRTTVSTLRAALSNTSAANSLLQVADGGLANIGEILQRQKSLAVQATTGTLSSAERGFLNQEFQNLTEEIDRLVSNTKFNQVTLLNGSLYDDANIQTDVDTIANTVDTDPAAAALEFTGVVAYLDEGYLNADLGGIIDNIAPTANTTGFDLANIQDNAAFVGKLGGAQFDVRFNAQNDVTFTIQVGTIIYTGTTAAANNAATNVTLTGRDAETGLAEGGTFELSLGAALGAGSYANVDDQVEADEIASALNNALSKVTFFQNRDMIVDASGLFTGSTATAMFEGYEDLRITDIRVYAAENGITAGRIEIDVNGETLSLADTANDFGNDGQIDAAGLLFVNTNLAAADQTHRILLTNATAITGVLNDDIAKNVEDDLKAFFRVGTGNTGLTFQTGAAVADNIGVQIKDVSTDSLYAGEDLDILTVANAQAASAQIDIAINFVTAVRADVGALQSRFDYAAANLQTSIQNTDAARGAFLDADISDESTKFASNQVLLQASISVLAQANQLPQNLLKLIG